MPVFILCYVCNERQVLKFEICNETNSEIVNGIKQDISFMQPCTANAMLLSQRNVSSLT